MGCCGLPEAERNGASSLRAMAHGKAYMQGSGNGGMMAYWRKYIVLCPLMRTWRI